jgi:hypothetical protein
MPRLYVQGIAAFTWAHTDADFTGVTDSDNNYFSGSICAGYAINDCTEITGSFTYYGANNYQAFGNVVPVTPPTTPPTTKVVNSMGYGLNTQEFGASLALSHAFTPNMVGRLSYGFITSNTDPMPDQSGGFSDFTAQIISGSLQVRF